MSTILIYKILYFFKFKSLNLRYNIKQFRIPLWHYQTSLKEHKENKNLGYTIELCSGLIDKNLSIEEIAKEECIEELGFHPKKLEKINEFYSGFGSGVSKQNLYFAEISQKDKLSQGGGIDAEEIEAVYVKVVDFEEFTKNIIRNSLLDYSYFWFMKEKAKVYNLA
ncbi:NUDIX hydrolase [Campylobacter novaezeelandiae]|nr:NUDIX hydrolase [Campylobacter novaezeelandiae]